MPSIWRPVAIVILVICAALPAAQARTAPETTGLVCERVSEEAARRSGVPVSVLKAISLTETGRKVAGTFGPWPWTVNMEGAGHWFDSSAEARAFVEKEHARGARSFDVGCFQINYRWHGEAFDSIDQMFDPLSNALYAARFLTELYAETGSWNAAAGAYHSRTKAFADRYSARFAELRQRFIAEDGRTGPVLAMADDGLGAPLSALSAFADPGYDAPAGGGDIPEIPDIVQAMYGGSEVAAPPRENTYPLLQRRAEVRPPSGVAPGASLFLGDEAVTGGEGPPTGLASLFSGSGSSTTGTAGSAFGALPGAADPVAAGGE